MEKQKKSYQTRLKIMKAYIDLMKDKDFDMITVKAIVEKAAITRGTFYLYFSDIYEMVSCIEEYLLSAIPTVSSSDMISLNALEPITYETCMDNSWERDWFEYYMENKKPFNALLGPHGDSSFYGKVKKILQNTLSVRMIHDGMPQDDKYDYFVSFIPDLYLLLAKEWTSNSHLGTMDMEGIAKIISTIRVGSLYMHHLESVNAIKKETVSEKNL